MDTPPYSNASRGTPAERRILVIKLSSLGDLFHALPAVHGLKTGLHATLDWVTQPEYAEVVSCFPDVDRVIPFPRRAFFRNLPAFLKDLRRESYDYVVDFQGLLKSAVAARMARSTARIGPSFHREGAWIFYTETAGPRNKDRHAVDENMDVLRHFGLPASTPEFPVRFPEQEVDQPRPRVAILPVSRWPTKNWPVASFAEVARRLQSEAGASIFLVGGADNVTACSGIADRLPRPAVNLAGKLSLVQTGAWLARMNLLISNDSGPVHMAAALNVPVLAVFGSTDPKRTGPFGTIHRTLSLSLPCRPCFSGACRYGDAHCLTDLPPDAVFKTAVEMLSSAPAPTSSGNP